MRRLLPIFVQRIPPYLKYLKPVRGPFILGILCSLPYAAANGIGLPYMIKVIFPKIFVEHGPELTTWQIALYALWLPVVFTIRGLAGYFNTYLMEYAGVRILEAIRLDYFRKLQRLPIAFIQKHKTGDLISRGLADTNQLQSSFNQLSNDIVKQPATLVFALGYLVYQAYHERGVMLVLVCLASIPLCVLPIRYVGRKLIKHSRRVQHELGGVTHRLSENLAAAREVRAFGLEDYETKRFGVTTRALVTFQMKAVKYSKILTPAIEIISAIGISLTFIYCYRIHIPIASFLAIISVLYMSYDPIKRLSALSGVTQRGEAALERVEEILLAPVTIADPANPVAIGRLRGDIAFEKLSFSYQTDGQKDGPPALDQVDAFIPAGTTCALVGPSGAGKTTFANLVLRFYDPTAGRVTIDGIDLRDMRIADLRDNIALVSQDPVLFNDTIYNNLLLGRQNATRAEIEQAARDAFAHDFILSFPQGYDTVVGERGATLSGGQRQRIAIARAFLRNAPILVLDEATSALDGESEAFIQKALQQLVRGKTVLIIAHRFSTIRDASKILVFEWGKIIDFGDHAALYERNPLYKSLYDRQNQNAPNASA